GVHQRALGKRLLNVAQAHTRAAKCGPTTVEDVLEDRSLTLEPRRVDVGDVVADNPQCVTLDPKARNANLEEPQTHNPTGYEQEACQPNSNRTCPRKTERCRSSRLKHFCHRAGGTRCPLRPIVGLPALEHEGKAVDRLFDYDVRWWRVDGHLRIVMASIQ